MLAIPDGNRAEGFPAEVVDYRQWNAHSVFFLDPAGNILEYIARHDLKNADTSPFSWADMLHVSEIGLVVDDVTATAEALKGMAAVAQYKGGDGDFMAMGDEYGLLLPHEPSHPPVFLQRVPEPKTAKTRVHFDLRADDIEAKAKELEALGARRIDVGQPSDACFIPMADPEGNEFCVCPGFALAWFTS